MVFAGYCYRVFRIIDDDGSRSLDLAEFKKGLKDYGVSVSDTVGADSVVQGGEVLSQANAHPPSLCCRMLKPCLNSLTRTAMGPSHLMNSYRL